MTDTERKHGRLMYSAILYKAHDGPWGGGGIGRLGAGFTAEEHEEFLQQCINQEEKGWKVRIVDPVNSEYEMREWVPRTEENGW